ncbi:DUF4172 domain-containing protein [Parapedobacter sp. 2B3]|uniref:DUF4172 domain-containing protein n=1 Tax=Parapedobacter sp. 2B3 TaxID=3342381 RepID=UPI0035B62FDE
MVYNWQLQGWPDFTYDVAEVQPSILAFAQETGEVNGLIQGLPDTLKQETLLQLMLSEAVKTSEIEGEYLNREDVMSSIRNNLGLNDTPVYVKDQRALDVTAWMVYFSSVILEAQRDAKAMVGFMLKKAQFYDRYKTQLDERQWKAINKMLDKGAEGFEGGMTAKKYMGITKVSKATATRDLQQLHELGVLVQEGAGRSVRYQLNLS